MSGDVRSGKSWYQIFTAEAGHDPPLLSVVRDASVLFCITRRLQTAEEAQILRVCQTKVRNRSLPMKIVDAEYQFDRHKLTLFFEAER